MLAAGSKGVLMVSTAPEAVSDQVAAPSQRTAVDPIVLRLPDSWPISETAMLELCEQNPEWDIEVTDEGWLQLMPGTGFNTSEVALLVSTQIVNWILSIGSGRSGGADGMVRFPGETKAMMAPDASWISPERAAQIPADHQGLLPVCPDFVLEVLSATDRLSRQQAKMERWLSYGVRLGWLLDIFDGRVWVYREGGSDPEMLARPDTLSGEDVLPGLIVDLSRVWERA